MVFIDIYSINADFISKHDDFYCVRHGFLVQVEGYILYRGVVYDHHFRWSCQDSTVAAKGIQS